jgi:uncharacterized protein (DUF433 family)
MMDIPSLSIPLHTDENGIIRVGDTRVTLDTILARHQQKETPEAIHAGFPTVSLSDIYAVIAYYLANQDDVDAYLQRRRAEGERIRQDVEATYSPEMRAKNARLRALLDAKRQGSGE